MTTFKDSKSQDKLSIAEILETLSDGMLPLRFTAYDGSTAGPEDADYGLHLKSTRGTTYLATAPGDLGMARAYVSGDLEAEGVHPGDPYEILRIMGDELQAPVGTDTRQHHPLTWLGSVAAHRPAAPGTPSSLASRRRRTASLQDS